MVTVANGLIGLLAIMYIFDRSWYFPIPLILFAVLLDGMDGMIARRFGSSHEMGHYLDAISDTVSFCFAPAILMYALFYVPERGSAFINLENAIIIIACAVVVGSGILRLARYVTYGHELEYFEGVPTPAVAILVISFSYLGLNLTGATEGSLQWIITHPFVVGPIVIVAGVLMISDLRYLKFRGAFAAVAAGAILFLMVASLLGRTLYFIPIGLLLGLISVYLITSPHYLRRLEKKQQ